MSVQRTYDPICPFLAPVQCHKGPGLVCPGLDMARLAHLDTGHRVLGGEKLPARKVTNLEKLDYRLVGRNSEKNCDENIKLL